MGDFGTLERSVPRKSSPGERTMLTDIDGRNLLLRLGPGLGGRVGHAARRGLHEQTGEATRSGRRVHAKPLSGDHRG